MREAGSSEVAVSVPRGRLLDSNAGGDDATATFTRIDAYRTVTSTLMILLGAIILVRTTLLGVHLQALAVGLGFLGLGAYRLTFVAVYFIRRRRQT